MRKTVFFSNLVDLRFVSDEFAVEHDGECDEDDHDGNEEASGHPCRRVRFIVQLHPAQNRELNEKQQYSDHSGKTPGKFNEKVHLLMGECQNSRLGQELKALILTTNFNPINSTYLKKTS